MTTLNEDSHLFPLLQNHRKSGRVEWIGIRPARLENLKAVPNVSAIKDSGLEGDHFAGRPGSLRQVTFIQSEHLATVASVLGLESIDPFLTRRNVVVSGINLLALKQRHFKIGSAVFEHSGLCHPCSRMEENLGHGGYNAMRGHGGILARVLVTGEFAVGDEVQPISVSEQHSIAS